MTSTTNTIELTFERVIPAPVGEVFDAWLDPETPGTLWNHANKLIFDPKVDGLFYVLTIREQTRRMHHYGRFTILERPRTIQHTFVSANTRGLESLVTLTFTKKGDETVLTLRHEGLPDDEGGRSHEQGWNFLLGLLAETCASRR